MSTTKLSLQEFNNLYSAYFYDSNAKNFSSYVAQAHNTEDGYFPFVLDATGDNVQFAKANEYFSTLDEYFQKGLLENNVTKSKVADSIRNVMAVNSKIKFDAKNANELVDTYLATEDNLKGLKVKKIKSRNTFAKRLLTATVGLGLLGGLFGLVFALIGGVAGGATLFEKLVTNEIFSTIVNHVAVCGGMSALVTILAGSALHGIHNTYYKIKYKFKDGIKTFKETGHAPICELIETIKKDNELISENKNSKNIFTKIRLRHKTKVNRDRLHAIQAFISYMDEVSVKDQSKINEIGDLYDHLHEELLDLVGEKYFDALNSSTDGNTVEYIDTLISKKHQNTIQKRGQIQQLILDIYKHKLGAASQPQEVDEFVDDDDNLDLVDEIDNENLLEDNTDDEVKITSQPNLTRQLTAKKSNTQNKNAKNEHASLLEDDSTVNLQINNY